MQSGKHLRSVGIGDSRSARDPASTISPTGGGSMLTVRPFTIGRHLVVRAAGAALALLVVVSPMSSQARASDTLTAPIVEEGCIANTVDSDALQTIVFGLSAAAAQKKEVPTVDPGGRQGFIVPNDDPKQNTISLSTEPKVGDKIVVERFGSDPLQQMTIEVVSVDTKSNPNTIKFRIVSVTPGLKGAKYCKGFDLTDSAKEYVWLLVIRK
jgi:hypothetical protein